MKTFADALFKNIPENQNSLAWIRIAGRQRKSDGQRKLQPNLMWVKNTPSKFEIVSGKKESAYRKMQPAKMHVSQDPIPVITAKNGLYFTATTMLIVLHLVFIFSMFGN